VLDLLRVADAGALPVRSLVATAELFGFTSNAVRVALARLAAEGLVESDERGLWRLAPSTDPLSQHVENWRLGEKRRRVWRGEWLAVWLPKGAARADRARSRRALTLFGFREGLDALWVRPDNLARPLGAVRQSLAALGLEAGAEPFVARDFSAALVAGWTARLWNTRALDRGYREARAELERSSARIPRLPRDRARVETFLLGGRAIRILATDALLPDEILPGAERAALHAAMLDYDVLGRRAWAAGARGLVAETAPIDSSSTTLEMEAV
jgi:phenylacetic acid degradation operon negative regulatory protein